MDATVLTVAASGHQTQTASEAVLAPAQEAPNGLPNGEIDHKEEAHQRNPKGAGTGTSMKEPKCEEDDVSQKL